MRSPFTREGRRHNFVTLSLPGLLLLAPCALCAATLPSNGRDGLFNLAQGWRLHPGYTPWHDLRDLLWYVSALCVVVLAVILIRRHDDHGLLFGYLTVLAVLSAAAMFLSFLARKSLEDQ